MAVLKQGMKGSPVKKLQEQLNKAGAKPKLAASGTFDAKTEEAVRAFQKKSGLKVDGKAGPNTMGALETGGTPVKWPVKDTMSAHKQLNRKVEDAAKSRADLKKVANDFKKHEAAQAAHRDFEIYADAYVKELDLFKKDLERIDFIKSEFDTTAKGDVRAQRKMADQAADIWKGLDSRNRTAQKLLNLFEKHHDWFLEALDQVPA